MNYIENYLTAERIEKYYSHFAPAYPKETLELFRKVINEYAEKNTRRNYYEYIVPLFHKVSRLIEGKEMVSILTNQYKNRRAMIEILNKMK